MSSFGVEGTKWSPSPDKLYFMLGFEFEKFEKFVFFKFRLFLNVSDFFSSKYQLWISVLDFLEVSGAILVPSESIPDSTFGDLNPWFIRHLRIASRLERKNLR